MNIYPTPDMKMEWPELVAMDVNAAREVIAKECPDVCIQIVGERDPVTMDLRMDRVRIIKDTSNKVLAARRG